MEGERSGGRRERRGVRGPEAAAARFSAVPRCPGGVRRVPGVNRASGDAHGRRESDRRRESDGRTRVGEFRRGTSRRQVVLTQGKISPCVRRSRDHASRGILTCAATAGESRGPWGQE
ncbi:hypothetical protein ATKI12_5121 [Kitasatospora sp. Ki12]